MVDLFNALAETAHAAAHASNGELKFKLAKNFIHLLCWHCRIPGKVVAFRDAEMKERRLSRFHTKTRFYGKLRRLNCSQHLIVLVQAEESRAPLMISMLKNKMCLEIIDVEKVKGIRFLIWLGVQILSQTPLLSTSFLSVWNETVIPICVRGAEPQVAQIRYHAWQIESERTLAR